MIPLHTQQSLDKLTWNEVQKLHSALGLKATSTTRTRRDYQRRIVEAQPQPVVEPEHIATPLTCATCPLARRIDGDRYCCELTDAVTRGHWEAKSDCYEEVAKTQPEAEVVETEAPIAAEVAPQETVAFQPTTATPVKTRLTNHPFRYCRDIWMGQHSFSSATYGLCECSDCISVAQPKINEPAAPEEIQAKTESTPVFTPANQMQKTARFEFAKNKIKFRGEVYTKLPKPEGHVESSSLVVHSGLVVGIVTWVGQSKDAGWRWKLVYSDIASQTSPYKFLAEMVKDGYSFYRLNQWQGVPAYYGAEPLLELPTLDNSVLPAPLLPCVLVTATTEETPDNAPPNRGNGRNRVQPTGGGIVKIAAFPRTAKPDNLMSSMTQEDDFDREFYDLAYLSEQQLKAQLAVEKTVIGSEDEAIALLHLARIDKDIEFYGRSQPEPSPSPVIVKLEQQMSELKKDVLSLFKITPFDSSILPTHDEDLDEQPPTEESEGTIHWRTPLEGAIVGKKGATRQFYIRNDEIFIIINAGFTASETKHPNVRHQQIRAAIEAGRAFNPKMYKQYACFARETENYNGIGRIKQGQDGRWWAWSIWSEAGTGHPFFSKEIAISYLDKMTQQHQLARQSAVCAK